MRLLRILFHVLLFLPLFWQVQVLAAVNFDEFFSDQTLRIDYFHSGDAKNEMITLDHCYRYGIWAGSRTRLIDPLNLGRYHVKIYDLAANKLIFSRGFDSYFGEYKTSDPALQCIARTYHESVLIPMPKNKIRFVLEGRDRMNQLHELYANEIDPHDIYIIRENLTDLSVKVLNSHYSGDPHSKADIVILAEGYTASEEDKYKSDLKRVTQLFLSQAPYKSLQDKFNIYGIFKPSLESGVDEPGAGVFKNTILNTTFHSLGLERYMLTEDNKSMRDLAAAVPYDAIVIMVNHTRYGGGGIYNLYCTFTTDNQWTDYVFLHEFGHSFGGLADEYYSSDVAYNDFYPKGVEPIDYNITALLDPNNLKWKNLATPGIALPTPWEKTGYDSLGQAWVVKRRQLNKEIMELKKDSTLNAAKIKELQSEYKNLDHILTTQLETFLKNSKYSGMVGAFEGAGYSATGLYRPMLDCLMFSKGAKPYCTVCEQGILRVLQQYLED
jgi:hypothetical protein